MNLYISVSIAQRLNMESIAKHESPQKLNILCSYEYRKAMGSIKPSDCKNFIADSGAFTAMNAGKKIDDYYVSEYIAYIKDNHIKNFIEMDLDEIIGYDKTLKIRRKIERETGLQPIPCWHLERGAKGWKDMCDEYKYVAISLSRMTETSRWLVKHKFEPLKFFLHEARIRGAKVHALGCNDLQLLEKYHFYSADSSTHTTGARYGRVMQFKNGRIKNINGDRTYRVNYDKVDEHNIKTMIEVMKYAEKFL